MLLRHATSFGKRSPWHLAHDLREFRVQDSSRFAELHAGKVITIICWCSKSPMHSESLKNPCLLKPGRVNPVSCACAPNTGPEFGRCQGCGLLPRLCNWVQALRRRVSLHGRTACLITDPQAIIQSLKRALKLQSHCLSHDPSTLHPESSKLKLRQSCRKPQAQDPNP